MKRLFKIFGFVLCTIIVFGFIFYSTYRLWFDPYRFSLNTTSFENTLPIQAMLTHDQAIEDFEYILKRVDERHPACMEGLPEAVQMQADEEFAAFEETVTVVELWQAASRTLAKLEDGHTRIRYISANQEYLPIELNYEDGVLYYIINARERRAIKAIERKPIAELYATYLEQFSYELESFASVNFAGYLEKRDTLAFLGIATKDNVSISYEDNTYDEMVYVSDKKQEFSISNEPFVSYSMDKIHDVGILKLKECEPNALYIDTLQLFFQEIQRESINNIIVDLRDNGGGDTNTIHEFIRYIPIDQYQIFGGVDTRFGPYLKKHISSNTNNDDKYSDLLFKGQIYVLTSRNTFSAAADFATMLSDQNLAEVVGEVPGGMPTSYGDNIYFQTPNAKLAFSVSYKLFHRVDQSKDEIPLIPDYSINAKDAIEKVYELINK